MATFVERRNGKIVGVYQNAQPGYAEEEIADDALEVIAFHDKTGKEKALYDLRNARKAALDALTGIGFRASLAGDTATAEACSVASNALLNITKAPEVVAASGYQQTALAAATVYAGIVAATPAAVRVAFKDVRL